MYNRIPGRRPKSIVYTGIWKRLEIIAEYTLPGNLHEVVVNLLETGVKPNSRASFNYENHYHVHCYNLNSFTYVVIVESGYSKKLSFELIEEIKDLRYPNNKDIEELAIRYNNNQNEDKITRINNQVNEINDLVMVNIQRVLKNTTKMEVIAKKTDEMQARALIFKKAGDELHGLARCQNLKWTLILSCVCILLVGGLGYGFYSSINN